jgi:riboflavin kinase/FMN adenylyltransferase
MLEVIEYGRDEYTYPALIVLGCFDSIHTGHRELFKKAKLQAKINGLDLGVMMFRDGKGGKLVYSFEERLAFLEKYNVKFVLVIDFTEEFKSITAIDFLHTLEDKINVKAYMSGKDFRFGVGAKGKASTLKNYAEDEDNGVWYMSVKDVCDGNEKISTTLIKSCLSDGNIKRANQLLGSEFFVQGEVVHGAGRGSELGFPTVNIVYPDYKYPVKQGVYKVKSEIDGNCYLGIANYGDCPTFDDERVVLEVHFDGLNCDLYDRTLKIEFLDYIRDIAKFESGEELKEQLNRDLAFIREEQND